MRSLLIKIAASMAVMVILLIAIPSSVSAADPVLSAGKGDACAALRQIDATKGCTTGQSGVSGIVRAVVNILSTIVGIAAVIMIIISGFKYVTSGGDSGSIASAKTTLVYALVGLVIAGSAQLLVKFVFNVSNNSSKVCSSNAKLFEDDPRCGASTIAPATSQSAARCESNANLFASDPRCDAPAASTEPSRAAARCDTDDSLFATDPRCEE